MLKFHPAVGIHSYKAVFRGTPHSAPPYASSASAPMNLSVSGATTTTIAASGTADNYFLTATVSSSGSASAPTGVVSFLDSSNSNAVLATAALGEVAESLSFTHLSSPATGLHPHSMVTGDFNGDGNLDMAVTNSDSNTLTLLLGNGDGTFTARQDNLAPGNSFMAIAAGDFNGDGKLDLAATNSNSNTVTILLGNGDGTFKAAQDISAIDSPYAIATGDFNGDGYLDLAVVNHGSSTVTMLLGNGDGTFTKQGSAATGTGPIALGVGDFNRDGIADLAVVNAGSNTVTILLGKGDGTFTPAPNGLTTGQSPASIALGDYNGDGNLDLAVAKSGSANVTIALGNGDGTFTPTQNGPSTGSQPQAIVACDFIGDGNLDLAVVNSGNASVTILLGDGKGAFTAAQDSPQTGGNPGSMGAGDFNGDGIPDLAVANRGTNDVTILAAGLTEIATATANGITIAGSGTHAVKASFPGNGNYAPSASAATLLGGLTPAAAPTFNVAPGIYMTAQTVSVSDATAGAVINYTTNGATPTTASNLYSGPITVSSTETVQAIATAGGYSTSTVATAAYTITPAAATPTFSVGSGTYTTAQAVSISDSTPGATIYYTTNGTTPTTSSSLYSVPITVASSETLEAIATATGFAASAVGTADYTISIPSNPKPSIGNMSPAFTAAVGTGFTLTANGLGFTTGSVIYWGTSALTTQFVSSSQLVAQVPGADNANAGIVAITVQTPNPGGGTSNALQFEIDSAASGSTPPLFTSQAVAVAAGSTATYPVILPSTSTGVSAACLNLPDGASCSFSASASAVTITTSATSPKGTYRVTTVFTESEPGAAAAGLLLPILLLPFVSMKRKLADRRIWVAACLGLWLMLAEFTNGCGGGSGAAPVTPPSNPTHQVTSSGVVSLTIQ